MGKLESWWTDAKLPNERVAVTAKEISASRAAPFDTCNSPLNAMFRNDRGLQLAGELYRDVSKITVANVRSEAAGRSIRRPGLGRRSL